MDNGLKDILEMVEEPDLPPHTVAYFQLRDIAQEWISGNLTMEEALAFLNELRVYLQSRIRELSSFDRLEDGDGCARDTLIGGIELMGAAVQKVEAQVSEGGDDKMFEFPEEAEDADEMISRAMRLLKPNDE